MNKYAFSLPILVQYCIDESNISIESIKDLKKIQKKYDVNLDFVIEEYEYKIDIENESDDEECGVNKEEIFDDVINELWNQISDELNPTYPLNDLSQEQIEIIYDETSSNFNNSKLEYNNIPLIMNGYDILESLFFIECKSENELNKEQIIDIIKYLDNQCSDEWGMNFEKIDLSEKLDEDRMVFVKTWNSKKNIQCIKNEKID
jgi:hypothetical protein